LKAELIELKNFMSYSYAKIDDFTPGLTLIDGPNGSGKSNLWDGPSWAIFGETVRGAKHDEVINWSAGKDCLSRFRFSCLGDVYDVRRYRKCDETDDHGRKFGDRLIVELYRGGSSRKETIEKASVAETQAWLLDRIKIDWQLYGSTVVFDQGELFNFAAATDKKQKELLSKVRRINFENSLKRVRKAVSTIQDKTDDLNREKALKQAYLEDDRTVEFKRMSKEFEQSKADDLAGVQEKIESLESQIGPDEDSQDELKRLREDQSKLKQSDESCSLKITKIRGKVLAEKSKIEELDEAIERMAGIGEGDCPHCNQPVSEAHIESVIKQGESKKEEHEKSMADLRLRYTKITAMKNKFQAQSEGITKKIEEAKERQRERALIQSKISGLEENLKEIKDRENPFVEKIKKYARKKKEVLKQLEEIDGKIEKLADLEPYLLFWEKAYSDKGIKSFLFDSMCGTLTNKSNQFVNILSTGEFTISFDTQTRLKSGDLREKFECIIHVGDRKVPFKMYSGGEKTMISLSIDMALARLMNDYYGSFFNFLVMDEQDQYLDNRGRSAYLDLLKELSKEQKVFVVAHDDKFKSEFDDVVSVRKRDGVSLVG